VEIHNLHRQVIYTSEDIGRVKVTVAASRIAALNPGVIVTPYKQRVSNQNIRELVEEYDIIIDGTDNFETRYLVNDACMLAGKPLVYGAISQCEGQVSVFTPGFHYRDLFPEAPAPGSVLNCSDAGVLGVLPGLIGTLMAQEAIKIITGIGQPLYSKLLLWNLLTNNCMVIELEKKLPVGYHPSGATRRVKEGENTDSFEGPRNWTELEAFDYSWFCGTGAVNNITAAELETKRIPGEWLVIDIREPHELPGSEGLADLRIPSAELTPAHIGTTAERIVFVCQSGKRSEAAVRRFSNLLEGSRQLYSLQGGVLAWSQFQQHEQRENH
jgi:adenylyltransferase/sulfurtransferase